jgi:hypothetical protein
MSDALSSIGSAAVTTVGTVAVTGMALKAVGKATQNMNHSNRGSKHSSKKNYNVWNHAGKKHSSKKSSMLGF